MSGERILIVDDEELIREMIKDYIEKEGYIIDEASDGKEALELIEKNTYAIVILDIMMPVIDGWTVCREIRKKSQLPVIMLSARGEEYDKLFGFELGVDDYLVKPFSPQELLARMRAIMRRSSSGYVKKSQRPVLETNGLHIDLDSRIVMIDGERIELTPKEYDLLVYLIKNKNRVLSRSQLLDGVWGYDFAGDYRTVDTHIKMLRDSLGSYKDHIKTVWGTGYKLETGETK